MYKLGIMQLIEAAYYINKGNVKLTVGWKSGSLDLEMFENCHHISMILKQNWLKSPREQNVGKETSGNILQGRGWKMVNSSKPDEWRTASEIGKSGILEILLFISFQVKEVICCVSCCWSAEQIKDRLSHKICNEDDQFSDKWPSVNWSFVIPCSKWSSLLRKWRKHH